MRPDQNELWERYEDAMFTLLMDEVAHQEGQEQLEWKKQLNNDPSAALPEKENKPSGKPLQPKADALRDTSVSACSNVLQWLLCWLY